MDGDLEKKHCCKVCGKSFPSGRSLGGHMRSHLPLNSVTEADEKPKSSRSSLLMGTGYGLRGNPKKTWRLSDSSSGNSSMRDKLCGECGKRFPSWRSLFGHMRCHSARLRQALEVEEQEDEVRAQEFEEQEGSWSLGGDKLLESHSDTETMAAAVPRRRRRSRRVAVIPDSSSSVCEYEKEQEDVALSLMMLSRDTRFHGGIGSAITESSDKNSAVHEDKGVAQESCEHDAVNAKKKGAELGVVGNVCPKIWLNKVDSEFSDNVYVMDDEFKSDKFVSSAEELKDSSRKKNLSSIDELVRKAKFDHLDQEFSKCVLGKRGRLDACDTKFSGDFIARFGFRAPEKRSRFECTTCNKVFDSYQALGGHRASHKRTNGCLPSRMDSSEISIENNASVEPTQMEEVTNQNAGIKTGYGSLKRFKDHECPICGKLFYSGQALGGHKRSHFLTSSDACHQTIVIEEQSPALPNLLDLNLPAPVDEESSDTNGNAEFKPWWVGSELMRGSVVGLITN